MCTIFVRVYNNRTRRMYYNCIVQTVFYSSVVFNKMDDTRTCIKCHYEKSCTF